MMTLSEFKALTGGGNNPNRNNKYIQHLDTLLALYETMHETLTTKELEKLLQKINYTAQDFLDHCRKRATPSRKKAGVKRLQMMAWREWNTAYTKNLAAKALKKQQEEAAAAALKAEQQAAQAAAQAAAKNAQLLLKQQQAQQEAAARARANWASAMAKVNALLGPGGYPDVRAKILDSSAWPEFFDPQHHSSLVMAEAMEQWMSSGSSSPFQVFFDKTFKPTHLHDPDIHKQVHYLSPAERAEFEIKVVGGRFFWAESGEPVHTGDMTTAFSGPGHAIWVCAPDRRFYSASHEVGTFHHSSFLAGGPVMGAGEWSINQGRLVMISNKTGHYRAGAQELFHVMLRLSVNGVDLNSVVVFWPWPGNPQRKYYRALDFMRARLPERFKEPHDLTGKPLVQVPAPLVPVPFAVV